MAKQQRTHRVPTVDIHCHTFNGDDLPVRGFVHGVHFEGRRLGGAFASLVDRVVQKRAPGYAAEIRQLDALLVDAPPPGPPRDPSLESARPAPVPREIVVELDASVEAELRELEATDPLLLRAAEAEIEEVAGGTLSPDEGIQHWKPGAVRATRWAVLYGSSRLDNTIHLIRQFKDQVDLFTPMLVDLELGLNDRAKTSVLEQVQLQERISRLSMLERLPGVTRPRVHPFVGFDPRREVLSARTGDPLGALDVVKLAVETYGFVGVKLYPPMGFRPLNNATTDGGPPGQDGKAVDKALREFYAWCLSQDVPITAHCNISNGARDAYDAFSNPDDWATVLAEFPGLHLNLAHFGGLRTINPGSWPDKIASLAGADKTAPGRYLFADVGNHRNDKRSFSSYMANWRSCSTAEAQRRCVIG